MAVKKKSVKMEEKAGITLSVSRLKTRLRGFHVAKQYRSDSFTFLSAAIDHVIKKVLRDTNALAKQGKPEGKTLKIKDEHLMNALRQDPDMSRLFSDFSFASAQHIGKAVDYILPAKEQKARKEQKAQKAERLDHAAQPAIEYTQVLDD